MSSSALFSEHINHVCDKARNMCSWILRTFKSRSPLVMSTLWKALVQPILDYCSQLWCPIGPGQIKQIEQIQKNYTRKVKSYSKSDYWTRLKTLRMNSQERRRERYRIIYIWKMLEKLVPDYHNLAEQAQFSPRNGRKVSIPITKSKSPRQFQHIRQSSLSVHGGKLFNALPKHIRNLTGCSVLQFKAVLDKYLCTLPDEPILPGYTNAINSNSILVIISSNL